MRAFLRGTQYIDIFKVFVFSTCIFEWPFYTGFTVPVNDRDLHQPVS